MSFSLAVSAQTRTLSGTVVDASTDDPIVGASVQAVGGKANTGVTTDINGKFIMDVPASVKEITVSYVGMKPQTVKATGTAMFIALEASAESLDQLVVVGYQQKKRAAVSGSVAVVGESVINNVPTPSFIDALQGQVAGLNIYSNSGDPSSNINAVNIRGLNTLNADSDPLYILDGAPVSATVFNSLNPNDIKDITVLKDAASVAIYGSRATNGVIIITTKKGSFGEDAQVTLRANYGWSGMASDNMQMMNAEQYIKFSELIGNKVPDDAYDLVYKYGVDTDWLSETFSSAAPMYNIEAAVRGGSEKVSYYASLGYLDQEGIICNSAMDRTNLRISLDTKPTEWFRFNVATSLAYTRYEQNSANNSVYTGGSLYLNNPVMFARMARPYDSARYWTRGADGSINFGSEAERLLWTGLWTPEKTTQYQHPKRDRLTANINLEEAITPIPGLTLRARQVLDAYETRLRYRYIPHDVNEVTPFGTFQNGTPDQGDLSTGSSQYTTSRYYSFTYTNTAEYNKTIGDHSFGVLLGQESIISKSEGFGVYATGQTDPRQMLLTQGTEISMENLSNSIAEMTMNSYFAIANYSYQDKLFFDANIRRDGSARFAPGHRWGTFWSVGATYNVKKDFLRDATWLQDLRVRLNYGINGNAGIGEYLWLGLVGSMSAYDGVNGLGIAQAPNHDLSWETTRGWNAGFSTRVLDRISVDFDFYHKRTYDMLMSIPYSSTTGVSSAWGNIADMTNVGTDITVSADIVKTKDWYFGIRANFNYNRNRIAKLFDGLDKFPLPDYLLCYEIGHQGSEFYMVRYAGVNPENGNPQWYDYEGNITEEFNEERDAVQTGKSQHAPYTGGFGLDLRWKGFSIRTDFTWAAEKYMVNNDRYFIENPASDFASKYNQTTEMFNIWTHPGQITDIPKYGSQIQFDDHLLENASFMRMKNLTFMYTVPQSALSKLGLKGLSFHFTGRNLWTITGFKGFDPEPGTNLVKFNYPNTRQYELGFEVSF